MGSKRGEGGGRGRSMIRWRELTGRRRIALKRLGPGSRRRDISHRRKVGCKLLARTLVIITCSPQLCSREAVQVLPLVVVLLLAPFNLFRLTRHHRRRRLLDVKLAFLLGSSSTYLPSSFFLYSCAFVIIFPRCILLEPVLFTEVPYWWKFSIYLKIWYANLNLKSTNNYLYTYTIMCIFRKKFSRV